MQVPEVDPGKSAIRALFQQSRERESALRKTAMELRKLNRGQPGGSVLPEVEPDPLVPREGLTHREMEVWIKLAQGLTNAQIADALQISIETVRKHVGQILKKLGVENRTSAARKAHDRAAPEKTGR